MAVGILSAASRQFAVCRENYFQIIVFDSVYLHSLFLVIEW